MPNRPARRRSARVLTVAVVTAVAVAVLAAVALWPSGDAPEPDRGPVAYVDATVTGVDQGRCRVPAGGDGSAPGTGGEGGDSGADGVGARVECQVITTELTSGPDEGEVVDAAAGALDDDPPELRAGDEVVLVDVAANPPRDRYVFADMQRGASLAWLALAFVVLLVVAGRRHGVRALAGLVGAGAVLVAFLAPALLDGRSPAPVVLTGAAIIAVAILYLGHGVNLGTTVALAGTLVSLAAVCGLALLTAGAADLSGLSALATGSPTAADLTSRALDARGLVVAGIVVGVIGALGDVTVSQVSIVAALRQANPGLPSRLLYREARRVGRDHVTSAITTLGLAYAGAALPLVLLVAGGEQAVGRTLGSEAVSVEIVRMLVGAMGLVVAAPITAALAATVLGAGDGDPRREGRREATNHIAEVPAHLAGITQGG